MDNFKSCSISIIPTELDPIMTNVPMNVGKQKHSNASPSKTEYSEFQLMKPFLSFGHNDSHNSQHIVACLEIPISQQATSTTLSPIPCLAEKQKSLIHVRCTELVSKRSRS
jgi:hypothetical protein